MSQPILYKNVDVEKIVVHKKIRPDKKVSFRVYIKERDDLLPLLIQTPEMIAPFGIGNNSNFVPDKDPKKFTWNLSLSFKGIKENSKLQAFKQKMEEIENRIARQFLEHANKYVPRRKGEHDIESLLEKYKPFIKTSEIYPSNIPVKIAWDYKSITEENPYGNPRDVNIYDEDKQLMDCKDIPKFSKVISVININRLYIPSTRDNWAIPIELAQAQVKKPITITSKLNSFKIIRDADSETDDEDEEDSVGSDDVYTDGSTDVVVNDEAPFGGEVETPETEASEEGEEDQETEEQETGQIE